MAQSDENSLGQTTATATGASPHIVLPEDYEYLITFSSAGAFVLDVQVQTGDPTKWDDLYDQNDVKLTIDSSTGKQNFVTKAGNIRMDVDTYNNPITMYARKV
jgi:hypothetical protein